MECPRCHSKNAPDSAYCSSCGAGLSSRGPSPPGERAPGEARFRETESIPAAVTKLPVGSTFAGRYRITRYAGRGGMGVLYGAEDIKLKRAVALKLLSPELTYEPSAKERFVHEAQAASSLDHTNICPIYEVDETPDGQMFIAMAFCEGEPLKKIIERGPLAIDAALDIAIRVADGLAAAHEVGVVHRDIKPANIMVKDARHVRIVDFGLAKLAGGTRLTTAGTVMGTVDYMSPEQARGEEVDARSDVWSLGVVLYEMLAGRTPFHGDNQQVVIHSILHSAPDPIEEVRGGIPEGLGAVIARCLSRKPGDRYQTILDLQVDLQRIRGETTASRVSGSAILERDIGAGRPWIRGRARKAGLGLIPVVLALVLLALLPPGRPALDTTVFKRWLSMSPLPRSRSVAILPFALRAGSPRDTALCDGLAEVTTARLAEIAPFTHSLWVVPSSDLRQDTVITAEEARDKLKANLVVAGGIGLSGDVINLTADLIDTTTLRPLKHLALSQPIANLSTWQDSLILRMTRALGVSLKPRQYAILKAGCTTVPDAYRFYLRGRGYLYPFRGEKALTDSAITAFKQAIREDASFAQAYVSLSQAYLQKRLDSKNPAWRDSARVACDRAIAINSDLPRALYVRGMIEYDGQNYDEALRVLGSAAKSAPKDPEPCRVMGMVYFRKARYDSAAAAFRAAIKLQPRFYTTTLYNTFYWLGLVYKAVKDYDRSAKVFREMIHLRPDEITGYVGLGAVYYEEKREPEAEAAFQQALRVKVKNKADGDKKYEAYSNLGTLYFYDARYADAAAMYEKASQMPRGQGNYILWGNYAECCFWTPSLRSQSKAKYERAIALAESALQVTTDSLAVLADLASYCSRIGDSTKAERYLEIPVSRDVPVDIITFRIAETYEQLGQREAALLWVSKALDRGYPLDRLERYAGMQNLRSDPRFAEIRQVAEARGKAKR